MPTPRPSRKLFRNLAVALVPAALAPSAAHGVLFNSTGDITYNTTAPTGDLANSGWQYEGNWGPFLGTAVGPHTFITAAHAGGGPTFDYRGVSYSGASFVDFGDVRVWQINGTLPSYAPLFEPGDGSEIGNNVVVIGRGTQRGAAVTIPQSGGTLKGWGWGTLDGVQRWGENQVTGIADYNTGDNKLLYCAFDASGSGYTGANEAHLSDKDSGGAVFISKDGQWKLAAINYGVNGPFSYSSTGSTFIAALFDAGGFWYGNTNRQFIPDDDEDIPTNWFASRISVEQPNILPLLNLPPTWKVDSGGTWTDGANWAYGTPGGIGSEADFRTVITAARTITITGAETAGAIAFDSSSSYTLSGAGNLSLDVNSGSASVTVASGNHTIAVPLALLDSTNFNVLSAATLTLSNTLTGSGASLTKQGAGTLEVKTIRGGGVTVAAGTIKITPDGTSAATSKVSDVTVTGGTLDMSDNDMAMTSASVGTFSNGAYGGVSGMLRSGAISSSTAAASNHLNALGVARADEVLIFSGGATTALFSGQTVNQDSVLVKYTYTGDANLSGHIDIDDYTLIDAEYNAEHGGGGTIVHSWHNGDFDLNGKVNIDDYSLIDTAYRNQGAALAPAFSADFMSAGVSAVPEPAVSSVLLAAALLAGSRRRRRSPLHSRA